MLWFLFILGMGALARMAGNGFGNKWGVAWLPELLFAIPFGVSLGYVSNSFGAEFTTSLFLTALGTGISYAGMQSATWMFLDWEGENPPNTERSSTLKPIIDFIAKQFGFSLGDEGYAWVAAAVKGFIVGTPVGIVPLVMLWPIAYEIGSHAKGRVERFGLDPHSVSEFLSGVFAGISVFFFIEIAQAFGSV